jgi:LCP family protein required for cell wall assembly
MTRRRLIALGLTITSMVVAIVCVLVWLGGRPLAAVPARGITVFDSPFYGDLLPLPSTDIHGVSRSFSAVDYITPGTQGSTHPALTRVETRPTPPLRFTLNYLLVGLDRMPGMSRGGRTDTIVIAVFDRSSDHIGLISVPRDLYVMVPDHGPARINAAYSIGRRQGRNGLEVLERVVEDTLAIPIHHSIAVDLGLFERAVDAVGGVTVDVPCPIQDNFIDPREENGRRPLDVPAGRQHMNGVTAAMYCRSRHGRSDWDRARRQQAVLLALRARLMSVGGVSRLPGLWDQFGEAVTTDMSRLDLFRLATRVLQADPSHLHGLVIGYQQTEHWTTPENRWVLIPRFDEIDSALSGLFSAPVPGSRPSAARCPAADVAITRPNRGALKRRMALRAQARAATDALVQSSSGETGSNPDHSSSP